jgi:hypothetical protein
MKKIIKTAAILLIMAGSFSCEKDDIDMSKIDFSNIEDLYKQPLPVIQKAVQGKWKWITYINGVAGWITMDMGVVEITKDKIISYDNIQKIYWKKQEVDVKLDGESMQIYVVWNKEGDFPICFFEYVKNDTMEVRGFGHTSIFSAMSQNIFIKIENN